MATQAAAVSETPGASGSSSRLDGDKAEIALSYRGTIYSIQVDPAVTTVDVLRHCIADATDVSPEHQKIVTMSAILRSAFAKKGADPSMPTETLQDLKVVPTKTPLKVMLVGPQSHEIEAVRKEDERGIKMQKPRQYHPSMLSGTKPRSTASASAAALNPFHSVRVHHLTPPSAPEHDLVLSRLKQLSSDEAVVHVCRLHGFQVGELTELLPHEHPNLLGLNENMGQRISLRLRTDRYDGLTAYREVRRVLLHELAHNKVNDHPPEFKILNSELNAQVEAFERAKQEGTHRLIEGDVYVPPEEDTSSSLSGGINVLGGGSSGHQPYSAGPQDSAARRAHVLAATMRRLEKAEADIERGCGSSQAS